MSKHIRPLGIAVAAAAAAAALVPSSAHADDNWVNPAGGDWGTAANWSAGVPTAVVPATFNTGSGSAYTVTLSAAQSSASLNVASGAVSLNVGGNPLTGTVGPSALQVAAAAGQTASLTVTATPAATTGGIGYNGPWTIGAGGTLTLVNGSDGTSAAVGLGIADAGQLSASATSLRGGFFSVNGPAATATLANGTASLFVSGLTVGSTPGSAGTLAVTGGSTVTTTDVDAATLSSVGAAASLQQTSQGTVAGVVTAGGTGLLTVSGPGSAFNANGPRLYVGAGSTGSGTVAVTNGGALSGFLEVGLAGGTGRVTVSGAGSTLTGLLDVGGSATSVAAAGAAITGTGVVRLDNGATGTVGNVTLYPGGTLQLASAAKLADTTSVYYQSPGSYNQAGGTLAIELSAANLAAPDLTVAGPATLGGTLSVTLGTGLAPSAGQTFDLFALTGGEAGTFSTVALAPPGGGLTWDTSKLYTAGTITAVPEPGGVAGLIAAGLLAGRRRRRDSSGR